MADIFIQLKNNKTKVDINFSQLFMDGQMMVEARWPNMKFPDQLWDHSAWATTAEGSKAGQLIDPNIASTTIDWTGALIMLKHKFFVSIVQVERHAPGNSTLYYSKDISGVDWGGFENAPYYVYGKFKALDSPGEWYLDRKTKTLYVWPLQNKNPNKSQVRIKDSNLNYAFEVKNKNYISIEGFHFTGNTFWFDNCNHCLVKNCYLSYPVYSRKWPNSSEDPNERPVTLMTGSYNTIQRCHIRYADIGALIMEGEHNIVENNLIHDVVWTGATPFRGIKMRPFREKAAQLIQERSKWSAEQWDNYLQQPEKWGDCGCVVRRNTIFDVGGLPINFGGQEGYIIEYNHVYRGGRIRKDISLIKTQHPLIAGSEIRYNWTYGGWDGNEIRGIRGDDQTKGLIVHHNVVWDCGLAGILVKGDYNQVYNNTVFDIGHDTGPINAIDLHVSPEPKKPQMSRRWPLLKVQNAHSKIANNAAITITGDNRGTPFKFDENMSNNYIGDDFQLMGPENFKFMPADNSPLINRGKEIPGITKDYVGKAPDVGAYEKGGEYWVPGITWKDELDLVVE